MKNLKDLKVQELTMIDSITTEGGGIFEDIVDIVIAVHDYVEVKYDVCIFGLH